MGEVSDKKDKLLKQVDHKIWNKFVCYAKDMGKTVAQAFEELVNTNVDQNNKTERGKKNGRKNR